ncbi:uncharacterized protein LOC116613034 isoform X2 [Nematostella vectensis]|uniref:uncharacterized protein LOC116613034 isoform X2 n=1 Tax=Nematostella vectensis TaxID=45351 RepID=UPI0013901CA2|nr:uncharacterized protein LOC116613034 isoform X2 [Nematostella vectensis]
MARRFRVRNRHLHCSSSAKHSAFKAFEFPKPDIFALQERFCAGIPMIKRKLEAAVRSKLTRLDLLTKVVKTVLLFKSSLKD